MKQFFTLLAFVTTMILNAQSINLEPSFGTNGIKNILFNGNVNYVLTLLDFENNNFLAYTENYDPTSLNEKLVFKINTDGTFDTNFGTNGKLNLPNYESDFQVFKQGTDKFIVAFAYVLPIGTLNNERAILRYNSNGVLDNTFGNNGEIRIESGFNSQNNILVLNDNSILFSNTQKFIKFTSNGIIDNSFGVNGIINVSNAGKILNSQDGNAFFYNTLKIEKRDYNGNLVNSFGTNGNYSFPAQNDYLFKSSNNKYSFMELGDLPLKFYDLNSNGTLNTNFNLIGSINLTNDNSTLSYYQDFIFSNNVFYFVGNTIDTKPFIVCYNSNGDLIQLNNSNSYKESLVSTGTFTSILAKNNSLYTGGISVNTTTNIWNLVIGKYNSSTLSVLEIEKQNKVTFQNPVQNELKINSETEIDLIEVYTLDSKKVKSLNSNLINTSDLSKGIYLAKIKFIDGQILLKKIIKE